MVGISSETHSEGWDLMGNIIMTGLEISEEGILICKDYSGRPSGEAYVEFLNEDDLEAAVLKHNENMGHRWGH